MNLYAWIDQGAIVTTLDKNNAPEGAELFNVDHEDQLYIFNTKISVDLSRTRKTDTLKNNLKKSSEKKVLEQELLRLLVVKEMDSELGTSFLNKNDYVQKLQQYQKYFE